MEKYLEPKVRTIPKEECNIQFNPLTKEKFVKPTHFEKFCQTLLISRNFSLVIIVTAYMYASRYTSVQCGNYWNLLSLFFDKNFLKVMFLPKKKVNSWFDEKILDVFDEGPPYVLWCVKMKNLIPNNFFSSNQLFSNKCVALTKFL